MADSNPTAVMAAPTEVLPMPPTREPERERRVTSSRVAQAQENSSRDDDRGDRRGRDDRSRRDDRGRDDRRDYRRDDRRGRDDYRRGGRDDRRGGRDGGGDSSHARGGRTDDRDDGLPWEQRERRRETWFDRMDNPDDPTNSGIPFGIPSGMNLSAGNAQNMSLQATRHARRIYVGGLPASSKEEDISLFFSNALSAIGGLSHGPGDSVVNVYINREKKFAFVEFRSVEEASNGMALDGIQYEGTQVKIRRPADYNAAAAALLGPVNPSPNLKLAAIGLTGGVNTGMGGYASMQGTAIGMPTTGDNVPAGQDDNRIFVGGIPYQLTEDQVRHLLVPFGEIAKLEIVRDRETKMSKGFAFAVFKDPANNDAACEGLTGIQMENRVLSVRKNSAMKMQVNPMGVPVGMQQPMGAAPAVVLQANTSRIIVLAGMLERDELLDDDEFKEIIEDMRGEVGKHGLVINMIIPRPNAEDPSSDPPGTCKVIVEYQNVMSASKAKESMHGRKFGGNVVQCMYLAENDYRGGQFDQGVTA